MPPSLNVSLISFNFIDSHRIYEGYLLMFSMDPAGVRGRRLGWRGGEISSHWASRLGPKCSNTLIPNAHRRPSKRDNTRGATYVVQYHPLSLDFGSSGGPGTNTGTCWSANELDPEVWGVQGSRSKVLDDKEAAVCNAPPWPPWPVIREQA